MARDLHKDITDRIVAQLKAGVVPWKRPWSQRVLSSNASTLIPRNAATGRPYSGINILLLWGKMDDGGYSDARFLTFKQAKELGGSVRNGEKGTEVVYMRFIERDDANAPDKVKRIPMLRSFWVFNVAQCDLPEGAFDKPLNDRRPVKRNERDATMDEFIAATGARFRHGEPRAFYTTGGDFVNMPAFDAFDSGHAYYGVAFHELGHWTGAPHRLNRTFGKRFGDRAYAAEELVAELTSAFVCAEFGIDNDGQNAAYIATWIKFLTEHDHAIVAAASAASKAVEFMRGKAIADDEQQIAA